jgi:CheY-like chemotaxis protein
MTPHAPIRVLVADDQAHVLEALRLLLKAEGYEIETATSPAASSTCSRRTRCRPTGRPTPTAAWP